MNMDGFSSRFLSCSLCAVLFVGWLVDAMADQPEPKASAVAHSGQQTPESNIDELNARSGRIGEEAPYILIRHYWTSDRDDLAVRAAKRLVELRPKDGRALSALGFSLLKVKKGEEAVPVLEKSIALGYDKSAIYIAACLSVADKSYEKYIPILKKIKDKYVDAYKPLIAYGFGIKDSGASKAFIADVLAGADLGKLVEDDDIYGFLVRYYKSISDLDSLREIRKMRGEYVDEEIKRLKKELTDAKRVGKELEERTRAEQEKV